jgi:hypothetical protein
MHKLMKSLNQAAIRRFSSGMNDNFFDLDSKADNPFPFEERKSPLSESSLLTPREKFEKCVQGINS